MMRPLIAALAWIGLAAPSIGLGQTISELQFKSKYDQFSLLKTKAGYSLAGKPVELGTFSEFLTLFTSQLQGACSPIKKKPDLTLRVKVADQWVMREFYIEDRIVKGDNQCAPVMGHGIYFAPLHRSWFDPQSRETLIVASPLQIKKGDEVLAGFELVKGQWRGSNPEEYSNWDFFESFTSSIKSFPVAYRVHKSFAVGKPSFTLVSGQRKFEFYKVAGNIWVVNKPGVAWLVGAKEWTNWLDMERSQWLDRWGSQLRFIADKGKDMESRIGTMETLQGQWSPGIRSVLSKIVLDREESAQIKVHAVRLLRQKPTFETIESFMKALDQTDDMDLLYELSMGLRTRYPKGPLLTPEMEEGLRQKGINEWRDWWKDAQHSKDKF